MGIIAEQWIVNECVHLEVQRAIGLRRAIGLIGRRAPSRGAALMFDRCAAVHGIGIRAPLDAVFCDADGLVVAVKHLQVGGFRACRGASFVLEMAAGEAARLAIAPGARVEKNPRKGG